MAIRHLTNRDADGTTSRLQLVRPDQLHGATAVPSVRLCAGGCHRCFRAAQRPRTQRHPGR